MGKKILIFPFMGKFNKDIKLTQLLKFISPIPINNDSALRNSSYYSFLNLLQTDINIITSINPKYESLKLTSSRDEIVLNEIDMFSKGLTKELLYTTASKGKIHSKKDNTSYLNRLGTTIKNSFLKDCFTGNEPNSSSFKKFSIAARLNALKVSPLLKKRLIDLFASYKGTNLHIDFWGDWCAPCMSELPNYPKLITALKDKPITFLFLSANTSEKSMLEIKEKLKINGDFVNLNNDEVKILTTIFGFQSYPSHFVVNNLGEVVDRVSRLSASSLQTKIKELEKLVIN